jgi:hypothetical protein
MITTLLVFCQPAVAMCTLKEPKVENTRQELPNRTLATNHILLLPGDATEQRIWNLNGKSQGDPKDDKQIHETKMEVFLTAPRGQFEGYTPVFQEENAGPH